MCVTKVAIFIAKKDRVKRVLTPPPSMPKPDSEVER